MLGTDRQRLLALAALVFAGGLLYARQLSADVPTVRGRGKVVETVERSFFSPPTQESNFLIQVPPGRRFVLTDIIVKAGGTTAVTQAGILRGSTQAFAFTFGIPAGGTFHHSFTTGIHVAAGETLYANDGTNSSTTWFVGGYLTTP